MRKQGYHHGNLRQALVEAALRLITEKGPAGFTLAEAAKDAGVTPAAVYRHFQGRKELITEAALQGHAIFREAMEAAFNSKSAPLAAFEATGRAYLRFAQSYPGHYMAMFESGLSANAHPDLARASERSRAILERAAEALSAQLPADRRPPASMFTAHIWAMSHGVVELFARGREGGNAPFPAEDLLEAGIGIYLRGLGLLDKDC